MQYAENANGPPRSNRSVIWDFLWAGTKQAISRCGVAVDLDRHDKKQM
jgi:hypothetical protein